MSTQYAGLAALGPTKGESFFGRGGELENIRGAYDRNINLLQTKKKQAIQTAKEEMQRFLTTRKKESFSMAKEALAEARTANDEVLKLASEKVDALSKYETLRTTRKKSAESEIKRLAESGVSLNSLSAEDRLQLEQNAGWTPGTLDTYYNATQAAKKIETADDLVEAQSKIRDLLRKLPKGETFTLPDGTVYQGVAEDENNQIFSETDNAGIVTYITINKATGEIVSKADGGKIGKSSKTTPSPTVPPKFTASELKKLDQAGLTNAPRQEQLDYLYKKKTDDDEDIF